MKRKQRPRWKLSTPKKSRFASREAERAFLFPELSRGQQALVNKTMEEREAHRLFVIACKTLGLPRSTQDRIEQEFKSALGEKIYRIAHSWNPKRRGWDSYLLGCLKNMAIDAIRKTGRHVKLRVRSQLTEEALLEDLLGINAPEAEDSQMRAERVQAIREGIARLPEKDAKFLRMFYFQGMKYLKISETLNLRMGTVKTGIRIAKAKLKRAVEHDPRIYP